MFWVIIFLRFKSVFKFKFFICFKERRFINKKVCLEFFLIRVILKEFNNVLGEFI